MVYVINNEHLTRRKLVTIDGSKVTSETDIPLGLNISLPGVKAAGADVRIAKLDGTPLARGIESKDVPNSDDVMIWYQWDTTASQNDQFYVYWGNSNLTEPADNSTYGSENVWNSDYNMVQLMNTVANSNIIDSTNNDTNSTSSNNFESGDTIDGNYGKGISADGVNEYYGFGDVLDLNDMNYTIELRLKGFEYVDAEETIISKWYDGSNAEWHFKGVDDEASGTKLSFNFRDQANANQYVSTNNGFDTTSEKTIQITYNGTTHYIYVDGVEEDTNVTSAIRQGNASALEIFKNTHTSSAYHDYGEGILYYARISLNTYKSANWALTTHKNVNNPTDSGSSPFYLSFSPVQHQRRVPQFIG
ncbi:hypothetical protein GQ473_01450 [archaeon]|nr:hypothetical protein [archaeon]